MTGLIGSLTGVLVGGLMLFPFSGFIETELSLPFLLPAPSVIVPAALLAMVLSILAGAFTSMAVSNRVTKTDTALILREGI